MTAMAPPAVYRPGYAAGQAIDRPLADQYIRATMEVDPLADQAVAALKKYERNKIQEFIRAGMENDTSVYMQAPHELRTLFETLSEPPPWYDPERFRDGYAAFHSYSKLMIPAFFAVTVRNASTLVAESFHQTGRVMTDQGPRRIRQNTRHLVEIMLPGSLERYGDGWKLSVRIRIVHAQIRLMIREAGTWDESLLGAPLSNASMAFSAGQFSAGMLRDTTLLGAKLSSEMRVGYMQAWRYASWLIGVPDELLFEGDEQRTNQFLDVANACEPEPSQESIEIAKALVHALPKIAGIEDPREARRFRNHVFRTSRALLGDDLADQLQFPQMTTFGVLAIHRFRVAAQTALHKLMPGRAQSLRGDHFSFLLESSILLENSYRLPDKLKARAAWYW